MEIEEARLLISLKNDEIKSMRSTLKTIEIKGNLRQSDHQYKIDSLQNKIKAV